MSFDKDAWIKSALKARYLVCKEDGRIYRRKFASKKGDRMSAELILVKPQIHKKSGRVYFNMTWLGITKSVLVNRVIAWAFLPNPQNLPQVNHKDGDKENNALSNLEWSSGRDNEIHAHRTGLKTGRGSANSNAKLTVDQVLAIRASTDDDATVAKRFNIGRSTVINIRKRKTWVHV